MTTMRSLGLLLACALCACQGPPSPEPVDGEPAGQAPPREEQRAARAAEERRLTVRQEPGRVYYWVAPGPRRVSEHVFGRPGRLREDKLLRTKVAVAEERIAAEAMAPGVVDLIRKMPFLVGLPESAWEDGTIIRAEWDTRAGELVPKDDGDYWYTRPTLFSDIAYPVPDREGKENHFELTYIDRISQDRHGPGILPLETPDDVELDIEFHDPDGNRYDLEISDVIMPPIPGYETQGGVMIDDYHHGRTPTGAPLMPKVYTLGAFWAIGRLYVNGEGPQIRVCHAMTTEVVRNSEYELVTEEELPLRPQERVGGEQAHHTHLVVIPIRPTFDGPTYAPVVPVFDPVETAFTVKEGRLKGKKQPFIHIMFEQDEIVAGREHLDELPDFLEREEQ